MFTKTATPVGKSTLSGKDCKAFRELLRASRALTSVAELWCEHSRLGGATTLASADAVAGALLEWLGVPRAGNCGFVVEVFRGSSRAAASANDSSVPATTTVVGVWSARAAGDVGDAPPIAMSPLSDRVTPKSVTLPSADVSLTLHAYFRLAQLWQLALAAAAVMCAAAADGGGAAAASTAPVTLAKKKQPAVDDDDSGSTSGSDTSSSSDRDDDDDDNNNSGGNAPRSALVFRVAALLFPRGVSRAFLECVRDLPAFPCVMCHADVCEKIARGADLMAAGTFMHASVARFVSPGASSVPVVALGHYVPVACGALHADAMLPSPAPSPAAEPLRGLLDFGDGDDGEQQQPPRGGGGGDGGAATQQQPPPIAPRGGAIGRVSMPPASRESRAVRVLTTIGDALWRSFEVAHVKASTPASWSVFATSCGASGDVTSLVARLSVATAAAAAAAAPCASAGGAAINNGNARQKPMPKRAAGAARAARAEPADAPHVALLRSLLHECGPSPWPGGIALSTPPQISAADAFGRDAAAFATVVAGAVAGIRSQDGEPTTSGGDSPNALPQSATTSSVIDDVMRAAAFHTLASLTKDALPMPLSVFGASVRDRVPRTGASAAAADWAATRWKRPVVFLREIAKPDPQQQHQQQIQGGGSSNYDAYNDWVVALVEQSPGNLVIASVNKSSAVFRDHKRASDAVHELVRNNNGGGGGDDADDTFAVCQAQGRIEHMSTGLLLQRSNLADDLDMLLFGDVAAAVQMSAAPASAQSDRRFPTLDSLSGAPAAQAEVPAPTAQTALAPPLAPFVSLDEVSQRVRQYARACGLVVTKQDVGVADRAAAGAKPGDIRVAAAAPNALRSLWGAAAPISAPADDIVRMIASRAAKGTLLRFQSGHSELRRGVPPVLELSAKRVHNHWVTTLTGSFAYYCDVNHLVDVVKRKLACSARVESAAAPSATAAATGAGQPSSAKSAASLIISGNHVADLVEFLTSELGVDSRVVHSNASVKK